MGVARGGRGVPIARAAVAGPPEVIPDEGLVELVAEIRRQCCAPSREG